MAQYQLDKLQVITLSIQPGRHCPAPRVAGAVVQTSALQKFPNQIFQRATNFRRHSLTGTGLVLFIVKRQSPPRFASTAKYKV